MSLLSWLSAALVLLSSCGGGKQYTETGQQPAQPPEARVVHLDRVVASGAAVEFTVATLGATGGALRPGNQVRLAFALNTEGSEEPLRPPVRPAAWVDRGGTDGDSPSCEAKIAAYARGSVAFRPEVDLNAHYVLTMNEDASISVIDPLLDVGGMTQLRAMLVLDKPGEDWVLSPDGRRLYITMPLAGRVAVADTETFVVLGSIAAGERPTRIRIGPAGRLWVGNDSSQRDSSGVTVIDPERGQVLARLATGRGHHEIAFSDKGEYAFVTNEEEGTVSAIDVSTLKQAAEIKTGSRPIAIDASTLTNAVYVAHADEGVVSVVHGERLEVVGRIATQRGASALRIAPGGRWGILANAERDSVEVFDALNGRILASGTVGAGPDEISFSREFAYVHATKTADVALIPLSALGGEGELPVAGIVGGQRAPAEVRLTSIADSIMRVYEHGGEVVIANPADQYVYYYMEGMKAPMGGFSTYGRTPRAVLVVDRSLREVGTGRYETVIDVQAAGRYQVAFLLDEPRVVHCFTFDIAADESTEAAAATPRATQGGPALTFEALPADATAGRVLRLSVRLTVAESLPAEVTIVATHASGITRSVVVAKPAGGGLYEASWIPTVAGSYDLTASFEAGTGTEVHADTRIAVQPRAQ